MKERTNQNKLSTEQIKLIEENDALVHYILRKNFSYLLNSAEYEDLAQEGRLSLIKAAQKFDATLGYEFSTYASAIISGGYQRYNRDIISGNGLKISRTILDLKYKINRLKNVNPSITDTEISEELGISKLDIEKATVTVVSLESPINDGESTLKDILVGSEDQYDSSAEDTGDILTKAIRENYHGYKADLLEEFVWSLVYLEEKLTQNQLADKYKISQAAVSRLLNTFKNITKDIHNM